MIELIVMLIIIGVIMYLVNSVVPMDSRIKLIINVIVLIVILLWVLSVFGLIDFPNAHFRRLR